MINPVNMHCDDRKPATPFAFSAYGLALRASHAIPGLPPTGLNEAADVRIWLDDLPPGHDLWVGSEELWYASPEIEESGKPGLIIWRLRDGSYFHWVYVDGHQFIVARDGTEVWAKPGNSGSLNDVTAYLLGPILGFLLRLRGVTCIHASAISVDDEVLAFVGPKGAGKSTTAAAFASRGYSVVADDIVALLPWDDVFLAQPGYPRLRLWPASLEALARTESCLARSLPTDWGNRRYHLDLTQNGSKFERRVLPLAAIYFLAERTGDSSTSQFETMSGSAALMSLVANTYASKLVDLATRAQEFKLLDRVVNQVRLRKFYPHTALDDLARISDVILADFRDSHAAGPRPALS